MMVGAQGPFGAQLKALREVAGFTQEELATIAGLSVHAVSALERGGAPTTGCSLATEIGNRAFVPYRADYFFYEDPTDHGRKDRR
jgi:transcriptional regulator with XRE-family HTH domain